MDDAKVQYQYICLQYQQNFLIFSILTVGIANYISFSGNQECKSESANPRISINNSQTPIKWSKSAPDRPFIN